VTETARRANKRNLIYQTVELDSAAADAVMMRPHPPLGGLLGIEMHEIAKCYPTCHNIDTPRGSF